MLALGKGWVALQATGDRWDVALVGRAGEDRTLAQHLTLPYAQGVAEDYARNVGAAGLVTPTARWRQQSATDGQRRLMRHLSLPVKPGLTKGEAADLISVAKASRTLRPGRGVAHG